MTEQEFLELLGKSKSLLSEEKYKDLMSKAGEFSESMRDALAYAIRKGHTNINKIEDTEKKMIKIVQDGTEKLQMEKQEIKSAIEHARKGKEEKTREEEQNAAETILDKLE